MNRLTVLLSILLLSASSFGQKQNEDIRFYQFGRSNIINSDRINDNHLSVLIGDSNSIEIKPNIRLNGLEDESFLSISLSSSQGWINSNAGFVQRDKKIVFEDSIYSHQMYLKDSNSFEWEIILSKKSQRNSFSFKIDCENIVFAYQDTLFDYEKEFVHRPDSVLNSYAVYHKYKQGRVNKNDEIYNYQTGKLFHIYRPKVWDSKGDTMWAEINIDTSLNILTIDVDKTFLEKALYPVTIDPTIGYTTMGASEYTFANYSKTALLNFHQTMTSDALLDSAYIGIVNYVANNSFDNYNIAVYTYDPDSSKCQYLTDKIWNSYPLEETTEWKCTVMDHDTLYADSSYTLAVSYNNNFFTGNVRIKFDTYGGWGDTKYLGGQSDFNWPSDLSGFADYAGYRFSAYLVYSEIPNNLITRRRRVVD